jgi:hypothetical protein
LDALHGWTIVTVESLSAATAVGSRRFLCSSASGDSTIIAELTRASLLPAVDVAEVALPDR